MAENVRNVRPVEWVTAIASVVASLTVVTGIFMAFNGAFTSNAVNAVQLVTLGNQIAVLSGQIHDMQAKLDNMPRIDQITEINRHLSALDARDDVSDNRQRDDETRISDMSATLRTMDQASKASLMPSMPRK